MSQRAKQVLFGYIQTQTLHAAVKLGVADALDAGPRSAAELSAELQGGPEAETLGRMLDVLVRLGLFQRAEDGRYAHNEDSRCLSSAHPNSLADLLLFCARESYYTFAHLPEAVASNEAVFHNAWGQPFWRHLEANEERRVLFARAMERQSEQLLTKLAADHDFSAYAKIVDLGGGKGQLFRPLAAAGARPEAVVLDLASVAPAASAFLQAEGLDHVRFEAGNFFEQVPDDADLYVLKFVLHDWADADCVKILEVVRRAMKPGAKLMIIELVRGGDPSPWSYLSDMLMLSTFGAKERSAAEFRALLVDAGFEVDEVAQVAGAHYSIVAEVAD